AAKASPPTPFPCPSPSPSAAPPPEAAIAASPSMGALSLLFPLASPSRSSKATPSISSCDGALLRAPPAMPDMEPRGCCPPTPSRPSASSPRAGGARGQAPWRRPGAFHDPSCSEAPVATPAVDIRIPLAEALHGTTALFLPVLHAQQQFLSTMGFAPC
ncbi:hypothetical protein U9M48_028532, partial [Paspalum notatum var. saurae]